jgi:GTP-binding protein
MKNIPLVTIVGVPNTGKSTLFNRLIGERKALVHSKPGMTRDIYKKKIEVNGKSCHIQDSGGFFLDGETISREINRRILREAGRSDLIIFLFDGRRELLGYEKDLYLELKKTGRLILPVINKVDHPQKYMLPDSYYGLKLDYIFVSAEHNLGMDTLLDSMASHLDRMGPQEMSFDSTESEQTCITIVGKPNAGKSSIINRILNDDRVIVSPQPGTTRDSVDLEIMINKKLFVLVDNAGIRKLQKVKEEPESAAIIRAGKIIRNADVVIFVLDISRKIDRNDLFIAKKILESAKPVILAANKWDLVEDKHDAVFLSRRIKQRFNFLYFAPLLFVSAETGKNITGLIRQVENIHSLLNHPPKTSRLNQLVRSILKEKKLMTENNRRFSPKFVSIESTKPFFIRFHEKSGSKLRPVSEIYLKKRLSAELELEGIPIFFNVSAGK